MCPPRPTLFPGPPRASPEVDHRGGVDWRSTTPGHGIGEEAGVGWRGRPGGGGAGRSPTFPALSCTVFLLQAESPGAWGRSLAGRHSPHPSSARVRGSQQRWTLGILSPRPRCPLSLSLSFDTRQRRLIGAWTVHRNRTAAHKSSSLGESSSSTWSPQRQRQTSHHHRGPRRGRHSTTPRLPLPTESPRDCPRPAINAANERSAAMSACLNAPTAR